MTPAARILACTVCHSETGLQVRAGIFGGDFPAVLAQSLLPFALLALLVRWFGRDRLVNAGIVLGIGLGGLLDGIVLHQILQVHQMLSNRLFPDTLVKTEINMFWDGLFHALVWGWTVLGIGMLWRALNGSDRRFPPRLLVGSMLFGWGLFNWVEGLVNHGILGLHHVVQRAFGVEQILWDLGFLLFGAALIFLGEWLAKTGESR